MAGHSKWSQIKRKKAANDQQRGKMISKHIRAIQTAVREGGGDDPSTNLALKNALAAAKTDDVPASNIDKAIERAVGGSEGGSFEQVIYEGYGPSGIALMVEALTDNRNRTAAEVRHIFTKHGGNMSGSTAWLFDPKGIIVIADSTERVQELAIELGADDLDLEDDALTIYTQPSQLYSLVEGLEQAGFQIEASQLTKVPQNETELSPKDQQKVLTMLESLEDLDDVQNVYSNAKLTGLEAAS
ncbi:MAG: YebC/PmpR family DNA-binding transcriptional regulator [Trueperaceae bacterium]|nr:MAG: YebC/PmpR family DNA-binding transcriptional regulator [Trueperaceae bacterium]